MTLYAGMDVSDKVTHICVVDGEGVVLRREVQATDPDVLAKWLKRCGPDLVRVVLETGPLSTYLYHGLVERDVAVVCIYARHAKKALSARVNKSRHCGASLLNSNGHALRPAQSLPARNSAAETNTLFPSRTTTMPVSVWIAVLRAISAARRMAATEPLSLGFLAFDKSACVIASVPTQPSHVLHLAQSHNLFYQFLMATNAHKAANGRFTVSSTGGQTTVRESKSGRVVALKGYGAMQGKFPLAKGIDLTKPIAAQVKIPKAKSGNASKRH
jgi:hypothetical protein